MSLRFKGDGGKKEKKETKTRKRARSDDEDEDVKPVPGTGRIVTSGDTINGFNTTFLDELEAGDVVLLIHPQTIVEERVTVSTILGNRSCLLVAPFSSNFSTTTTFQIEKRSTILKKKARKALEKKKLLADEALEDEDAEKAGLSDGLISKQVEEMLKRQKKTVQVREKVVSAGQVSYRTVNKLMDKEISASEALAERMKQGRDKFCW